MACSRSWDVFKQTSSLLCEAYSNLDKARCICAETKLSFPKDSDFKSAALEIKTLTKKLFAIAYQHENVLRNRKKALMYYRAVVQLPCLEDDEYWKLADEKVRRSGAQGREGPTGSK